MKNYAKFIIAAVGAAAIAAQVAIEDGSISTAEWGTIGLAALAAIGVYFIPNKDGS